MLARDPFDVFEDLLAEALGGLSQPPILGGYDEQIPSLFKHAQLVPYALTQDRCDVSALASETARNLNASNGSGRPK